MYNVHVDTVYCMLIGNKHTLIIRRLSTYAYAGLTYYNIGHHAKCEMQDEKAALTEITPRSILIEGTQ